MDTALTGGQVREGVVEDTYVVRSAPRSRGGDPELAAGGPTKRKERQGVLDTGNRIGKALTGRPSGLPVCRRPVTMPPPWSMLPARGPRRCISDTCVRSSQEGVGGFAGQWCARHTVIRVLVVHRMGMVVGSCKTERAARSLTRLTGRPRAERKHSLAWAVALGSA